ncbi:DUF3188 domain-containing protein [Synechococcus sp. RSCCF101]|nr:DUF3188 domain-containing protein [Synechococcus sp. RSCCF101]
MAAPLLVLIALLGMAQRQGRDRLQAVPALLIGTGLTASLALQRRRRRAALLQALRSEGCER